jgi:putative endonuclease
MSWHLYILRCADGTLYTGITNDLVARVKKHNQGRGAKYTRSRRPVVLAYEERKRDATSARKREAQVKKMSRAQKLALVAKKAGLNR